MNRGLKNIQALLIQVREQRQVAEHEQACFMERIGFEPDAIRFHNLIESPRIRWADVDGADVIFIGGAAAHSATADFDYTQPMMEIVRRLADTGKPTFGSCWGHQFIARALGGAVVTDRANEEVGSFEIELTDAGQADPLFAGFPPRFMAHMGHHDRVSALPPGGTELAYSARCRNQVYRLTGKPIYGAQFHAEMSAQRLVERLSFYRDSYLPSDEAFESLRKNPRPTPEVDGMLKRFLDEVQG